MHRGGDASGIYIEKSVLSALGEICDKCLFCPCSGCQIGGPQNDKCPFCPYRVQFLPLTMNLLTHGKTPI